MLQFATAKKHTLAIQRRYILRQAILIDTELAAIGQLPISIEVHDHRVLPAAVIAELVEMPLIKAAFAISRIVKLIAGNTCVASFIEV
ncbi:MAG: hypothetical protein JWO03_1121 [Bacteroidetes bacterium]|nr:hypothetical protein [Bacteroidota bacterium]